MCRRLLHRRMGCQLVWMGSPTTTFPLDPAHINKAPRAFSPRLVDQRLVRCERDRFLTRQSNLIATLGWPCHWRSNWPGSARRQGGEPRVFERDRKDRAALHKDCDAGQHGISPSSRGLTIAAARAGEDVSSGIQTPMQLSHRHFAWVYHPYAPCCKR